MSRRFDEGAWAAAWSNRYPHRKQPRRRRSRKPAGNGRYVLGAALVMALTVSPFAIAQEAQDSRGEGRALIGGERNPGSGTLNRETGVLSGQSGGFALRFSNKNQQNGGGLINGCRSGAIGLNEPGGGNPKPCYRASNIRAGRAFEFSAEEGTHAGRIDVGDKNQVNQTGRPFTTNAAGVVDNLNSDRVDSKHATSFLGSQLTIRSNTEPLPDGTSRASNVECQPGETIAGGGGNVGVFSSDINWLSSRPTVSAADGSVPANGSTLNAWRSAATNPGGGTGATTITAWAICATQPN